MVKIVINLPEVEKKEFERHQQWFEDTTMSTYDGPMEISVFDRPFHNIAKWIWERFG